MPPKLKAFDLCAGIGGFSYALRPLATTVAYAEKELSNKAILERLMREGTLPAAQVFDDVNLLTNVVEGLPRPDLICAGFPCQDLSTGGKRAGLYGRRSSLFFTVCEVVRAWSPSFVMLENVPTVRQYMGVIEETMRDLGYECTWDVFSAAALGAPHLRKRWYCLCRRADAQPVDPAALDALVKGIGGAWSSPPPPSSRIQSGACKACPTRLFALGNSIVPQCARHAFAVLHARAFGLPEPVIAGIQLWDTPIRIVPPPPRAGSKATQELLTQPVTRGLYHSPRASFWNVPVNVTARGLKALSPQLAYQDTTPRVAAPKVNPLYVEWMMGYPPGYTKIQCDKHPTH